MPSNTQRTRPLHQQHDYSTFASFIAADLDRSTLIFNRFDRLAARNLLMMQSELHELQTELDMMDAQDGRSSESKDALVQEIRSLMSDYRQALLSESQMASLPIPDRRTLKAFRWQLWKGVPWMPGSQSALGGNGQSIYDDHKALVALKFPDQHDRMSQFAENHLGQLFKDNSTPSHDGDPNVAFVSERSIATFVSYFSTILAAVLLFGAILILYNVRSPNVKLGLVTLFTMLFAAPAGLLTNARRAEVYGTTAAYAAVLVVFISGELGGGSG
ncbi:hypothetical protein PG997_001879 [Apiospora hydei]|uniref:DUF6594 domain-containing protein n=1 Tax=Apiospora hydei TaxID=1337664 RepID=A0ABR1X815_9PEZI